MGRLFARRVDERAQRDELLSAYLDGQLSAGERARLETRLAANPALRAELEALRHTVALVRDLPPVPIPRNFILPQAMAARPRPVRPSRPRRAWAAPLLTAATAVVSLLFVVVLAGDLLLSRMGGQAFAPAAEAPQAALAPSPAGEQAEAEAVVEAEAEVVEEPVEEEVEKAVPVATAPAAAMEAPPEAPAEATAEVEADRAETPEGTQSPAPVTGGGAEPTASEVAARSVEEETPAASAGAEEAREPEVPARATIPPQRALAAILGLSALGLALATVWAWRARRR